MLFFRFIPLLLLKYGNLKGQVSLGLLPAAQERAGLGNATGWQQAAFFGDPSKNFLKLRRTLVQICHRLTPISRSVPESSRVKAFWDQSVLSPMWPWGGTADLVTAPVWGQPLS